MTFGGSNGCRLMTSVKKAYIICIVWISNLFEFGGGLNCYNFRIQIFDKILYLASIT